MKNLLQINDLLKIKIILLLFTTNLFASNPDFPFTYYRFHFFDFDCDACGCSNSGGSFSNGGILQNDFIGVRYIHQKYTSKNGIFNNSPIISEYYNTIQVWGQFPLAENLTGHVFIPYHNHYRVYSAANKKVKKGLGDVSALLNYTVLAVKKENTNHVIKIGAGVKLPTGKFNSKENNSINPSFQVGTGSYDIISNLQYFFRYKSLGISNAFSYYFKGENSRNYQFGNQFNLNTNIFYQFKLNQTKETSTSIIPYLGLKGEFFDKNKEFNVAVKNSNGYAFYNTLGLEVNTKLFSIGGNYVIPSYQKLANKTLNVKHKFTLYVNINL